VSVQNVKRILLGSPIPTAQAAHERLGPVTGLAVFASDALSSVAYATEEILLILVLAGSVALRVSLPIAVAISILIVIVVSSYRQTILAYPKGGGAYVVTRENLGRYPSLVSGAALLTDYVLTVAVSVAAGIAALTSAIPPLYPYRVTLCVVGVAIIAVGNLRGIRESGRLFSLPTYLFLAAYAAMIAGGLIRWFSGEIGPPTTEVAGILVRLRGADGDRGSVRRRSGLPGTRGPDRPARAGRAGRHPGGALPGYFGARLRFRRRPHAG
jgi:amino acid transporter